MPDGGEGGTVTQRERSRKARAKWRRLVAEQGRSARSVAAFCRERRLCVPHFYWWKKRLRAEAWPSANLAFMNSPFALGATGRFCLPRVTRAVSCSHGWIAPNAPPGRPGKTAEKSSLASGSAQ